MLPKHVLYPNENRCNSKPSSDENGKFVYSSYTLVNRLQQSEAGMVEGSQQKRVVVVGAGWAGLGATYHLAKQGYDVTLLEAGPYPGGLVAGWQTAAGKSVEAGIHGFWYPYKNIFSLINELEINPFTTWTRSSQYSPAGLEVESPIFQDLPRLPSPLGTFLYTQFKRLPLID
ncbi:FAD-dependent oxidoreductase, partial [Nostoc sp. CHAB 5715]|uniref:FAD-dependent oxidoreductase n=1 Tax=Nostoc sp. CHAB 5715 TaxID=2780400 RepID=UPI0034D388B4